MKSEPILGKAHRMREWLDNLQVGDDVVISGGPGPMSVFKVVRLTKTLIFTTASRRFRRRDGHSPGTWAVGFLQEPTPVVLNQVERDRLRTRQANLAHKLRHYDWGTLSLEKLVEVYDSLPKSS